MKSQEIPVICHGRVARVLADVQFWRGPDNAARQLERVAVDLCQDLAMAAGLVQVTAVQTAFADSMEQRQDRLCRVGAPLPLQPKESPDGSPAVILLGILGESPLLNRLADRGLLEQAESLSGRPEAFVIKPLPAGTLWEQPVLVIAGTDARGAIYGAYTLSEKIGVSPWYWFSDVPVPVRENLTVDFGEEYRDPGPGVRYRGLFINDEDESMLGWARLHFDGTGRNPNVDYYRHVFELILRLKGNTLWPAMHEASVPFHHIPENAAEASRFGVITSSSHCEILLRNNVGEWRSWVRDYNRKTGNRDERYDFTVNETAVMQYWRERLEQNRNHESILTLGIRGIHDGEFGCAALSQNPYVQQAGASDVRAQRVAFVHYVLDRQLALIREIYKEDIPPLVFIPYKEMNQVYNDGLNRILARKEYSHIMLMWAEDNYGNLRQTPTLAETRRPGGAGLYYHASFIGWPTHNRWLNSIPLSLMCEELGRAYQSGVRAYWILNVGDIKLGDHSTEYFFRIAWAPGQYRAEDGPEAFLADFARREYGLTEEKSRELAGLMGEHYHALSCKKPEYYMSGLGRGVVPPPDGYEKFDPETMRLEVAPRTNCTQGPEVNLKEFEFSTDRWGDEALVWLQRTEQTAQRAKTWLEQMNAPTARAFYEQFAYHALSAWDAAQEYVCFWKAWQAAEQGRRNSTVRYTELSRKARDRILSRQRGWDRLFGGKWKDFLVVEGTGGVDHDLIQDEQYPPVPAPVEGIGVFCEGSDAPGGGILRLNSLIEGDTRYFDVFAKGMEPVRWRVESSEPWLRFSHTAGEALCETRVLVWADWNAFGERGAKRAEVLVYEADAAEPCARLEVRASGVEWPHGDGFVQANGYVAAEAEHYAKQDCGVDGSMWKVVRDGAQHGDAMKSWPDTGSSPAERGARLSYPVWFEQSGVFRMTVYRLPILNEGYHPDGTPRSCDVGVCVDGKETLRLRGNNVWAEGYTARLPENTLSTVWERNVVRMYEPLCCEIGIDCPGWHRIELVRLDSATVIDRFVIEAEPGVLGRSLLGPTESPCRLNGTVTARAQKIARLPRELENPEKLG